jgi:MYXO-CTERM domain-containing protein
MHDQSIQKPILSAMIALAVVGFSPSAEAGEPCPDCFECGDGIVEGDEECDDGNMSNTDSCLDNCKDAECGDGYTWEGHEECDGGEGCTSYCKEKDREPAPCCGDGKVQDGEECDDGNMSNTDSCLNDCEDAKCGDGYTWEGHEECDGGEGCNEWCKEKDEDPCDDDDDHDGVKNCDDKCEDTEIPEAVPTTDILKPNHSALIEKIGDPYQFTTAGANNKPDTFEYTIVDTGGCSCEQILDEKPGNNEGEYMFGCSPGTMKNWVKAVEEGEAAPIWDGELDDLNMADPEGMKMNCNVGETRHGPAWAFLALALAAFGLRRRS